MAPGAEPVALRPDGLESRADATVDSVLGPMPTIDVRTCPTYAQASMLTFDDIPEQYHGHRTEPGPRYHRFAAGLLDLLTSSSGTQGAKAGHRLVQAAWHLRYAGVGLEMHRIAPNLSSALGEDDQFVYLSGFQLSVTSAVAAIDLSAASLVYLAGHEQREPDLRSLASTQRLLDGLSPRQVDWVATTCAMPEVDRLIDVRNALVHRHVPTSVTVRIGGQPSYSIRVEEVDNEVAVDPSAAYGLAVDRFVALGLLLLEELGERGT